MDGIFPDTSWTDPITVTVEEPVNGISTEENDDSFTEEKEEEEYYSKNQIVENVTVTDLDGRQKKTPIPFLFSKSSSSTPKIAKGKRLEQDEYEENDSDIAEIADSDSRSSFDVTPISSPRSTVEEISCGKKDSLYSRNKDNTEEYQTGKSRDLVTGTKKEKETEKEKPSSEHQTDILFRTYAAMGSTNNASPKDYHKIVWDLSEGEDKNTILDGMEGVFHEKVVATDAFVAPRTATYNIWVFANWRAAKMEDGEEVPHPVAADIYIEIVDAQNNWKKRFDDKHQIGRGTGGGAYKMDEGDTLYVYLYNPHPQKIQVMSEKTFLNVTTVSNTP